MKAKNVALAVLIIAMAGVGIWWVSQPNTEAPAKATQTPVPAKVSPPPTVVVEMPKLAPVAASASSSVADESLKAPAIDPAQPNKPVQQVTEAGTIEFTEGVPVTIFGNDGTKFTLTAHRITASMAPGSVEQMQIEGIFEGPDAQQTSAPKITVLNGKSVRLSLGDSQSITSLSFTAHMNMN